MNLSFFNTAQLCLVSLSPLHPACLLYSALCNAPSAARLGAELHLPKRRRTWTSSQRSQQSGSSACPGVSHCRAPMCACAALVLRFTICSVWYVALGLLGRDAAVARAASREHYHCAHWPGALAPCPAAHGLPQPMSCCGRAVRQAAQCTCTSPGHLPSPASRRLLQRRERERDRPGCF